MNIAFIDLGPWNIGNLGHQLSTEHWQDHGIGILRTVLKNNSLNSCVYSTKNYAISDDLIEDVKIHNKLVMNVRTYNFHDAKEIAIKYKMCNPNGLVFVGGMHVNVDINSVISTPEFDKIVIGNGVNIITDILKNPHKYERVTRVSEKIKMDQMPWIDRRLWPKLNSHKINWPLENNLREWGGGRMVSILSSNVCPWRCSFCNEASYIENSTRRSVDNFIAELNHIWDNVSEFEFVVIHDSMFFQQPAWLEEFLEKYCTIARKPWPFWAAARADTVRKWPNLFKSLVENANWKIVSIGLESGSPNTLRTLNKECSVSDNLYAIQLINNIGENQKNAGIPPVKLFSNIMWGVPGETTEDVLDTARMVKLIKNPILSNSLYSPYPGGALGNQIIAEGKSLLSDKANNRDANANKMLDVDYDFVRSVMSGKHDSFVNKTIQEYINKHTINGNIEQYSGNKPTAKFFKFKFTNGQTKLSWGTNEDEAIENLQIRLGKNEFTKTDILSSTTLNQFQIQSITHELS